MKNAFLNLGDKSFNQKTIEEWNLLNEAYKLIYVQELKPAAYGFFKKVSEAIFNLYKQLNNYKKLSYEEMPVDVRKDLFLRTKAWATKTLEIVMEQDKSVSVGITKLRTINTYFSQFKQQFVFGISYRERFEGQCKLVEQEYGKICIKGEFPTKEQQKAIIENARSKSYMMTNERKAKKREQAAQIFANQNLIIEQLKKQNAEQSQTIDKLNKLVESLGN